jgi:hypothetical protein
MGFSSSGSAPVQNPGAMDVYNHLLGLNQQNYSAILSAYGSGMSNLNDNLGGIYGGFDALKQEVGNTLGQGHPLGNGNWGVATPAAQAIDAAFERARGETDQGLINSGLGSTTLRGNLQNQNAQAAGQAYGSLGAQLAQTMAGYQSNIGMAGLQARMSGLGMQNQMTEQMGSTLGNYRFANTAGNLWGQQSHSESNTGGGGGGGGGGGSGSGMGSVLGGLPGSLTAWGGAGGGGGLGHAGAYNPGYSAYDPFGVGGGGGGVGGGGGFDFAAGMRSGWEGGPMAPSTEGLQGGGTYPMGLGDWNDPGFANSMWDLAG